MVLINFDKEKFKLVMSLDYINEAFKRLDLLNEETFDTSLTGMNQLSDFMENDDVEDIVRVIDDEATSEEELKDSYIGKVIINCNVCHSHVFRNKEDIQLDSVEGVANSEDQCPYCGEQEGFTIVGEIAPYAAATETTTDTSDETDAPIEEPAVDTTTEGEDTSKVVGESLKEEQTLVETGKWKPHTMRLLKLIGSDLADTQVDETLVESFDDIASQLRAELVKHNYDANLFTIRETDTHNIAVEFDEQTYDSKKLVSDLKTIIEQLGYAAVVEFLGDRVEIMHLEKKSSLTEAVNNVNVETDDSIVNVHTEDDGKVVVSTEPKSDVMSATEDAEIIVPVSDETQADIEATIEEPAEEVTEEPVADVETDEADIDFDEIDEESIDDLGESYLKRVYENVDSYKTTNVTSTDNQLIVEGVLKFTSGVEKKTGFIFEAQDVNSKGKLRFTGFNKHLTEDVKAYTLVGSVQDKKLVLESLSYNYKVKDASPVRGLVRKSK